MIKAIHKESNEFVSAFKLTKDAKWIGKERELFIAPRPEISNWDYLKQEGIDEVIVSYVKTHTRNINERKILVIPHFRIETKKANPNQESESQEHLLAKEGIYEEIFMDLLTIKDKKISEIAKIKDIDIEMKLSPSKKSKIADVLVTFEKDHSLYGKGIVFEIQFSYQNSERTEERTYDRINEGFSVCWMWNYMFKDNKLKNKELDIIPFRIAIKDFEDKNKAEWIRDINKISKIYENKIKELDTQLTLKENAFNKKTNSILDYLEKYKQNNKEILEYQEKRIKEFADSTVDFSKEALNQFKDKTMFEISNSEEIKKSIIKSLDIKELTEKTSIRIIDLTRDSILNRIDDLINKYVNNSVDFVKINEQVKDRIDTQIIPRVREAWKIIKGDVFFTCQNCKKIKRVKVARVNPHGEGILCGECFMVKKGILESSWYKRDKEERDKGKSL